MFLVPSFISTDMYKDIFFRSPGCLNLVQALHDCDMWYSVIFTDDLEIGLSVPTISCTLSQEKHWGLVFVLWLIEPWEKWLSLSSPFTFSDYWREDFQSILLGNQNWFYPNQSWPVIKVKCLRCGMVTCGKELRSSFHVHDIGTLPAGNYTLRTMKLLLSGVPDYFGRNKISSGGDLSHYSSAPLY